MATIKLPDRPPAAEGPCSCLSRISKNQQCQVASSFIFGQVSSAFISLLPDGQAANVSEVSFLKEWSTLSTYLPFTLLSFLSVSSAPSLHWQRSWQVFNDLHVTKSCDTNIHTLLDKSVQVSWLFSPSWYSRFPWHPRSSWVSFCCFPRLLFFAGFSSLSTWHLNVRCSPGLILSWFLFSHYTLTGWPHSFWGFPFTSDMDNSQSSVSTPHLSCS